MVEPEFAPPEFGQPRGGSTLNNLTGKHGVDRLDGGPEGFSGGGRKRFAVEEALQGGFGQAVDLQPGSAGGLLLFQFLYQLGPSRVPQSLYRALDGLSLLFVHGYPPQFFSRRS